MLDYLLSGNLEIGSDIVDCVALMHGRVGALEGDRRPWFDNKVFAIQPDQQRPMVVDDLPWSRLVQPDPTELTFLLASLVPRVTTVN